LNNPSSSSLGYKIVKVLTKLAIAPVILFSYIGFEALNAASDEIFDAKKDTAPAFRRGSLLPLWPTSCQCWQF
jgi:amino acid transporter